MNVTVEIYAAKQKTKKQKEEKEKKKNTDSKMHVCAGKVILHSHTMSRPLKQKHPVTEHDVDFRSEEDSS
jgi:hypothetical protein